MNTGNRLSSVIALAGLLLTIFSLNSCDKTRVMEENQQVANYQWKYEDVKKFSVNISDTVRHYNIYINLRHSFTFEWRNTWVNIETTFPGGRKFERRVNLVLSEPDGHWFGDCLGDNCDIQIPIQTNAYFPELGTYQFSVRQDMRVNPLPLIKSVGMRIEEYHQESPAN